MKLLSWLKGLFIQQIQEPDYTKSSAFVHTWSLMEFAKKYGKMQIRKAPEVNNRESYQICRFVKDGGNYTYASVSSRMQGITSKEISESKDRIRVGQLHNGKYVLYDFRFKPWEDVDLGL